MATAMKRWIALTGLGLVLVAVATLPPSTLRLQPRSVLPEVERFEALDAEARRQVGVLQATLWSDSLSELAVRTAEDGVAVGAFGIEEMSEEPFTEWGAAVREYVGSLRPRAHELVVGVYYQPSMLGQPEGVPGPPVGGAHTYVGVRDGTPYCLQVEPRPSPPDARSLRFYIEWLPETGIGVCRLFAKYGLPGDGVRRWLDDGAIGFARSEAPPPDRRSLYYGSFEAPPLPGSFFGLMRPQVVDRNPAVGRCLAGDADACLQAVSSPASGFRLAQSDYEYIRTHSPLTYNVRYGAPTAFGSPDQYLLADLEAEAGPDTFARFWTSAEEMPVAFEAAFGVDPGSWIRDWAQREDGVYHAGPGLRAGTKLWSLLALVLLAGLASLVGVRRQVA